VINDLVKPMQFSQIQAQIIVLIEIVAVFAGRIAKPLNDHKRNAMIKIEAHYLFTGKYYGEKPDD
jgi:hypothetical protein